MKTIPNYNPDHDIYFGIISASRMDPEVVDDLLFGSHRIIDHSFNAALDELAREFGIFTTPEGEWYVADGDGNALPPYYPDRITAIEACPGGARAIENINVSDEMLIEGDDNGTKYITTWLGGALHFFIMESQWYTTTCPDCSPCVPNAGNLDAWIDSPGGDGGNRTAFLPPMNWLSTESHAAVTRCWREVHFT